MNLKSILKKFFYLNGFIKFKRFKNKKPNSHFGEFAEDIFINRVFKNLDSGFI